LAPCEELTRVLTGGNFKRKVAIGGLKSSFTIRTRLPGK
jgi:hypothetical protein